MSDAPEDVPEGMSYCVDCEAVLPDEAFDDGPHRREGEGMTGEELREDMVGELEQAHAAILVYVTFPRDDNEVDEGELATGVGSFTLDDDLSDTEIVAAGAILEVGSERAAENAERANDASMGGGGSPVAMGMPVSLGQLLGGMGGTPEDTPDSPGFL